MLSVSVLLLLPVLPPPPPVGDQKRTLFRKVFSVVFELRPLVLRKLPVRRKLASSVGLCSSRGERTDGVGVVGLRGCGVNNQLPVPLLGELRSAEWPPTLPAALGCGDGDDKATSMVVRSSWPGFDLDARGAE